MVLVQSVNKFPFSQIIITKRKYIDPTKPL
jgi:hypothetical protein